jgi:hypothetical protein
MTIQYEFFQSKQFGYIRFDYLFCRLFKSS